jgi:hypothetical protein
MALFRLRVKEASLKLKQFLRKSTARFFALKKMRKKKLLMTRASFASNVMERKSTKEVFPAEDAMAQVLSRTNSTKILSKL